MQFSVLCALSSNIFNNKLVPRKINWYTEIKRAYRTIGPHQVPEELVEFHP